MMKILLRAILGTLLLFALRSQSAADKPNPPMPEEATADAFSIVVLPDTQFYSEKFPETYVAQTRWIREHAKKHDIRFVIHVGDIVQNPSVEKEWKNADRAHRLLDGKVPYSVLPGNHDMVHKARQITRGTPLYNKYFGPSRFSENDWYGGNEDGTNDNNFCLFEAGGRKFLVLSLEFLPTDKTLAWAAKVLEKHADRHVILATHVYMRPGGRDQHSARQYRLPGNSGAQIWDKFVRKQPNIFVVFSGHIIGHELQVSKNDAGHAVYEILADYQGLSGGGQGWLRTMKFDPQAGKIKVRAYSPLLDKYNDHPKHSFTIDMPPVLKMADKKAALHTNSKTVKWPAELVKFKALERNPVFAPQGQGHWDVKMRERGWILRDGDRWQMWYTGYDGTREGLKKLGYATSTDGLTWWRHAKNPLYKEHWVEDMMVVRHNGKYLMFAEGRGDQAHLLKSSDGVRWKRVGPLDIRRTDGQPIKPGPYGTPTVFHESGTWYLFYERYDSGIWVAKSKDLKVWINIQDEPVMKPGPEKYDGLMIALNQVIKRGGRYYAYYHGSGTPTKPRQWCAAVAVSDDLIKWQKYPGNPLTKPAANKSSGIVVPVSGKYWFYTMHDHVDVHVPVRSGN